jgi:hypothetical protein
VIRRNISEKIEDAPVLEIVLMQNDVAILYYLLFYVSSFFIKVMMLSNLLMGIIVHVLNVGLYKSHAFMECLSHPLVWPLCFLY